MALGLTVAAGGLALDQVTKQLAEQYLVRGRMVDILGPGWGLQLTYNDGGAFGLPAPTWFFLGVTVIVIVLVARNLPHVTRALPAVAYGALLAGALGNALDRVVRTGDPGDPRFLNGHVVDFLAIRLPVIGPWPRFNVADIAITVGFVLLVTALWLEERDSVQIDQVEP